MPYIYDENAETEEKKVERLRLAQELIKRQHPMVNEPISAALPFLQPFARCCGCINKRRDEDRDGEFVNDIQDTQKEEDKQR